MKPRILYLATADARGHLMRAQLLSRALIERGAEVRVLTTSDEGATFLGEFGIAAEVLSRHYAVQFDAQQNMQRAATDRNVARYLFDPRHMLRDIWRLRRLMADVDLLVNDSFHPALLVMGCLPGWRRKVVHVYGASLRRALQSNFHGRLPHWLARAFAATIGFRAGAGAGASAARLRLCRGAGHGAGQLQPADAGGPGGERGDHAGRACGRVPQSALS